jgi:hypothetical protein
VDLHRSFLRFVVFVPFVPQYVKNELGKYGRKKSQNEEFSKRSESEPPASFVFAAFLRFLRLFWRPSRKYRTRALNIW